jgi:CheY-like chemotaxis protein
MVQQARAGSGESSIAARRPKAMRNDLTRILCIDDNSESLELMSMALGSFSTDTATTNREGLAMARRGGYSLFIIDYYMPDGNGDQFCRDLRKFDRDTPVLFVSGSDDFSARDARSIGAQGMIKKCHLDFVDELRQQANQLTANH